MKTRLLAIVLIVISFAMHPAFGCSRNLDYLFWSPIIDRVSGDCSFVGHQPNPSGILFVSIIAAMAIGFVVWRARR